ncbi:prepilin-type N-terminal cleavage/methylation domain-containing protein [Candidatus Peregrinibacteria bacterium]|nr:prepilin-type N-terminal cleavage/methylation domain-containing protein [Candidatus Peregrinibacteria bacterium]
MKNIKLRKGIRPSKAGLTLPARATRLRRDCLGVTLVEVLVGISIFSIATVVAASILVSIVKIEKMSNTHNALYSEAKIILQELTKEIENGTIDYEEYYNVCVIQQLCGNSGKTGYYGINYGVYGSRFYDPGAQISNGQTANPDDLGAECSYKGPVAGECQVVYNLSLDLNTGQNPFMGNQDDASAFCEKGKGICSNGKNVTVDQLFIIDKTGTQKTIIAKKVIKSGAENTFGIGLIRMEGKDLDQNGIIDTFTCKEGFNCYGKVIGVDTSQAVNLAKQIKLPIINGDSNNIVKYGITVPWTVDLIMPFYALGGAASTQFIPITPLNADIKNLQFIITPIEDPYKAYAESAMQVHPTVTIIMTIGLSPDAAKDYPGTFKDITVQTTVAAGLVDKINSYPPVSDIRDKSAKSWIKEVLTGAGIPPVSN